MMWSRRGFSLIELLIVLAVLAVLVGLALPRLDSDSFRADANVRLVRTSLEQARKMSSRRSHDVIVSFDVAGTRIRIAEDLDNNHEISAAEPVHWRALTEGSGFVVPEAGVNGDVGAPVIGDSLVLVDRMPSVTFHPDGSSTSSVEVYLQIVGRAPGALRAVTLSRSSGETHWFRGAAAGWKSGGL